MIINITEWATDSYFDLVVSQNPKISKVDYENKIRPNVELLLSENTVPLKNSKFKNSKFWGPAESMTLLIKNGYKMKWHNFGDGNFQLRLCIAIIQNEAYLCRAYIKNDKTERREMARFKVHVQQILNNKVRIRGQL